jgi:hypothetical protein
MEMLTFLSLQTLALFITQKILFSLKNQQQKSFSLQKKTHTQTNQKSFLFPKNYTQTNSTHLNKTEPYN